MLAGERFSDRPRAVSHVIAAFVRTYNDLVDDPRRRDLLAYAGAAIGTRGRRSLETRRATRLLEWYRAQVGPGGGFELWALGIGPFTRRKREVIAERTARYAASSRSRHDAALALLDDLIGSPARELAARAALIERERDDLRGVERAPAGELLDLRPAREAVRDHERSLA